MPAVDKDWGDMHDQQFVNDDPAIWSNKSHRGCFYQQNFKRAVFPDGVRGAELYGNYDNCVIPAGFTLMPGATNRRIDVQNDRRDWILDDVDDPVEPMDKKRMLRDGDSIDPRDIPDEKEGDEPLFRDARQEVR